MEIESIGRIAFDAVYEANVGNVYRTALRYTKNSHTSEEVTQNVFLKLYIYMEHVDMKAVSGWLSITAKHMALNQNRKGKQEVLFEEIYDEEFEENICSSSEDEFFQNYMENEYSELIESIFADLYKNNERWYDAITITYCLKKPQKEVAEIMGISIETLHSILYRAKQWIIKNYQERYDCLFKA